MTVEAALALCSLTVMLALAVGAVAAVGAQLRCLDAAREAARLVARGEPARAEQAAARIAPTGARLTVRLRGDLVTATVTGPVLARLPGLSTTGYAVGVLEPGVPLTVVAPADPAAGTDPGPAPGPLPPGDGPPADSPPGPP